MATRTEVLLQKISLDVSDANKKLDGYVGKVKGAEAKIGKSGAGMVTSFSAVKASIAALGVGFAINKLDQLAQRMDRVTQANRGFEQLTKRAGLDNVRLLKELKEGTRGLLNEQELQIQANNALALGLDLNEKQMGDLAAGATKLGRALGLDVNTAMTSLITGIGRQSRMMLDNLGIIVSADIAQQKYADSLGRTVASLTLSERKTAFMDEAVKQLNASSAALTDTTETWSESWNKLGVVIDDTTNKFLRWLNTTKAAAGEVAAAQGRARLEALGVFSDPRALAAIVAGDTGVAGVKRGRSMLRLQADAARRLEFLQGLQAPALGGGGETMARTLAGNVERAKRALDEALAMVAELAKIMSDPKLLEASRKAFVVTFREAQAEAKALKDIIAPAAGEPGADTSGMPGFGAPDALVLFPDALEIEATTQEFENYANQLMVVGNAAEVLAIKQQAMADTGALAARALIQMGIAGDFSGKALGKAIAQGISQALEAVAVQQAAMALAELAAAWGAIAIKDGAAARAHFKAAAFHGKAAAAAGVGAVVAGRIGAESGGGGGIGGTGQGDALAGPVQTPGSGGGRNVEIRVFIDGQGFIQDPDAFVRDIAGSLEKEMTKVGA